MRQDRSVWGAENRAGRPSTPSRTGIAKSRNSSRDGHIIIGDLTVGEARVDTEAKNYLAQILQSLCHDFGANITLEPEFERAGYIDFPNGKRVFFKGTSFDINGQGSGLIAKDKEYAARFLALAGLPVPVGILCFSPSYIEKLSRKNATLAKGLSAYDKAIKFSETYSFPLIVKPNEGSEGDGVRLVFNREALCLHLSRLFDEHERVLVQCPCDGEDFRIVVLDGEVISAYRRTPLSVVGDGVSTVAQKMDEVAEELRASGRNPALVLDRAAVREFLVTSDRSLSDVLGHGEVWPLLPNANLSMGGAVEDVTEAVCDEFCSIAARAAAALGLRYAGVDLLCAGLEHFDETYVVLEVNSAPGLNNFGRSGERQNHKVFGLYRKLMAACEGEPR